MYTSSVLQQVKKDLESWTTNFVEASNEFYGGNFPVCPYARQARIKGQTTYALYPGGNIKEFIQNSVNKLIENDEHKQMLIVLPPRAKWTIGMDKMIYNINKRIIPLNYFALKGSANGSKSSYPGLLNKGEYQLIGLNTLDKVLEGVEWLKQKGYYKNWSEQHYNDIVVRRQRMYDKYGKQDIKAFYDKNNFPGKYSANDLLEYYNGNRYLNFIQQYISGRFTVLDAGCGTGFTTNYFARKNTDLTFTGIDFAESITWAEKISSELQLRNTNYIKADLNDFESDTKYNVVLCQGVLHHIPAYNKVLKKLQGMVNSNGLFIIGLYHPWGKMLQRLLPTQYQSNVLEEDQEKNPFELSFTKKEVVKMFKGYTLIDSHPSALMNWRNGGLTVYVFRKAKYV